jgi:hypothetical protein
MPKQVPNSTQFDGFVFRSSWKSSLAQTVCDGSDLDYTSLAQCEGLGVIGMNQTAAQSRGLHLHSTFAVAPTDCLWACCGGVRGTEVQTS